MLFLTAQQKGTLTNRICDSLRAAPVPVAFPPAAGMRRADARIRTGRWGVRQETLGITSLRLTGHKILDLLTEELFHCLMNRTYKSYLICDEMCMVNIIMS